LIFGQNVFVIGGLVRLDSSAVYAYQVPSPHHQFLTVVFCQRYERCSTCGTKFDQPVSGATPIS
jgi:hypothetical protein